MCAVLFRFRLTAHLVYHIGFSLSRTFFVLFRSFFPSVWPLSQATHLLYQTRSLLSTPFFGSSGRFLFLVVSFRPRFPASQALSSELVYITTPPPLMSTPFFNFFRLFSKIPYLVSLFLCSHYLYRSLCSFCA